MATVNASLAAARAALPQQNVKLNLQGGDIQTLVSSYTVPAGGLAIGDVISWGFLPFNSRVMPGSKLFFGAGAASSTLNLGDPVNPTRYMAATSVAAAGSALAENQWGTANGFEVTVAKPGDNADLSELRSVVAGAALQAGQVINLVMKYAGPN